MVKITKSEKNKKNYNVFVKKPDIINTKRVRFKVVTIMRIDAYNQVNQIYQTTTQTTLKQSGVKKQKDDQLEISQIGKDIHLAKKAIAEQPDVREDKVQKIKEQMKNGTYEVSMSDVAEKMLSNLF